MPGLFSREVPKPVGNQLNHNLLVELIRSLTLTPKDLARLDAPADGAG